MNATIRIDGHPEVQGQLVIEGEDRYAWHAEVPLQLELGAEVWIAADVDSDTYAGRARVKHVTVDAHGAALTRLEGASRIAVLDFPRPTA
jgi:hypothetical protein